jgi:hypothetical protein
MVFRRANERAPAFLWRTRAAPAVQQTQLFSLRLTVNVGAPAFSASTAPTFLRLAGVPTTIVQRAGDGHVAAHVRGASQPLSIARFSYSPSLSFTNVGRASHAPADDTARPLALRAGPSFRTAISRLAVAAALVTGRLPLLRSRREPRDGMHGRVMFASLSQAAGARIIQRHVGVPVLRATRTASGRPKAVQMISSSLPTLVVRNQHDRHVTLTAVTCRHPWIVGWHTITNPDGGGPLSLNLIDRVDSAATAAGLGQLQQRPTPAMEFGKPDAAVERTVSDAMRRVTEMVRRETATAAPAAAPPQVDLARLTRQVYEQLERELRVERERRGL